MKRQIWGIKDEYFEKVYPHQERKRKVATRAKPVQLLLPLNEGDAKLQIVATS